MLRLNSITSCNVNGIPLYTSNLYKKIETYRNYIKDNLQKENNEDELYVFTVQGLYGYRCGIFGYLLNKISYTLSQKSNPTFIQLLLNSLFNLDMKGNDYEILSLPSVLLFRLMPFLNIGIWDLKNNMFPYNSYMKYNNNNSLSNNFTSLFTFKPFFDSGCGIYSNIEPIETGFERWNVYKNIKNYFNKGLIWSIFKKDNKVITVINVDMIDDYCSYSASTEQIKQILNVKNTLYKKYIEKYEDICYETYITGNFLPEIKPLFTLEVDCRILEYTEILQIIRNENLQIHYTDNDKYILYDKNTNILNSSKHAINNITTFNFIKNNDVSINISQEIIQDTEKIKEENKEQKPEEIKEEIKGEEKKESILSNLIFDYFRKSPVSLTPNPSSSPTPNPTPNLSPKTNSPNSEYSKTDDEWVI
jgi:hypothetical protein